MFRQHSASSRFLCQEKEWPRMDAKRRENFVFICVHALIQSHYVAI